MLEALTSCQWVRSGSTLMLLRQREELEASNTRERLPRSEAKATWYLIDDDDEDEDEEEEEEVKPDHLAEATTWEELQEIVEAASSLPQNSCSVDEESSAVTTTKKPPKIRSVASAMTPRSPTKPWSRIL